MSEHDELLRANRFRAACDAIRARNIAKEVGRAGRITSHHGNAVRETQERYDAATRSLARSCRNG